MIEEEYNKLYCLTYSLSIELYIILLVTQGNAYLSLLLSLAVPLDPCDPADPSDHGLPHGHPLHQVKFRCLIK